MARLRETSSASRSTRQHRESLLTTVHQDFANNSRRKRIQQADPEADAQAGPQRVQSSARALPEPDVDRPDEEGNHAQESKHQVGSNSMSKTTELLASSDNGAAHPQVGQQQNPPGIVQNPSNTIPAPAEESQPSNDQVAEGIPSQAGTQIIGGPHFYGTGMKPTWIGPAQQPQSSEASKNYEDSDSKHLDQSVFQLVGILPRWLKIIVSIILLLSWAAITVLGSMYGTDRNSWNSARNAWALEKQQLTDYLNKRENWWGGQENAWHERSEKQTKAWKKQDKIDEKAWKKQYDEDNEAWKNRWQDGERAHEKVINEWLAREQQWNIERSSLKSANRVRNALGAGVTESLTARSEPEDLLDGFRYCLPDDLAPSVCRSAPTRQASYQVSKTTSSL